jgi:DNA-binding response OmpR family regulator
LRPVVVILDYLLPGLSGAEVTRELRARLGEEAPPIVLVTGLSTAERLAAEIGADAFLRKPFDVDTFLTIVARLTGPPKPHQQL